jgi:hypothetical protein
VVWLYDFVRSTFASSGLWRVALPCFPPQESSLWTARCGLMSWVVSLDAILDGYPMPAVSYPLIVIPRPELDGSILSSADDPRSVARHIGGEDRA